MNSTIDIISPNMMKLFIECQRKFYFKYIEQIPSPVLDKGFELGKNIHALAAYYLKGEDINKLEQNLSYKEKEYWDLLKKNPYYNYEIVGVEKNVTSKIDNYWIGGRIDAIVKNNKDYYILDYKTGGVDNSDNKISFDPQTMIYLMMCDELYTNYDSLSFVYLDLKNNENISIVFSEKLRNEYYNRLLNICEQIHNFKLKQTYEKAECVCEYSKICQYL